MLGDHWDYDGWKFRPLRFVDGNCICVYKLVDFIQVINYQIAIDLNGKRLLYLIYIYQYTDIPIKNILIIVVPNLHQFISYPVGG